MGDPRGTDKASIGRTIPPTFGYIHRRQAGPWGSSNLPVRMSKSLVIGIVIATFVGVVNTGCAPSGPPPAISMTETPPVKSSTPPAKPAGSLTVNWPGGSRDFTREELWNHAQATELSIADQAAHSGQKITFHAVPMPAIFEGITFEQGETLEFDSLDGFSLSLDPAQVLNTDKDKARAYLAIEDPSHPWPKLKDGKSTAGPLYLVWENPEKSDIGQEQWPFQLRSFSLKASIESRFPALVPQPEVGKEDPIYRGYQAFLKNCFSCHTLNGEGTSRMGPDLNWPHSPTEYLQEEYFRKLVRDPQSLRSWKGSRMSSFSQEMLPEPTLDDLIAYLRHKAEHRSTPRKP